MLILYFFCVCHIYILDKSELLSKNNPVLLFAQPEVKISERVLEIQLVGEEENLEVEIFKNGVSGFEKSRFPSLAMN